MTAKPPGRPHRWRWEKLSETRSRPRPAALVLDLGPNYDLDLETLDTLAEIQNALAAEGVEPRLAGLTRKRARSCVAAVSTATCASTRPSTLRRSRLADTKAGRGSRQLAGFGGHALYVHEGRVRYVYNFLGMEPRYWQHRTDCPTGEVTIGLVFEKTGEDPPFVPNGTASLIVNGETVATGTMRTQPGKFTPGCTTGGRRGDTKTFRAYSRSGELTEELRGPRGARSCASQARAEAALRRREPHRDDRVKTSPREQSAARGR